MHAGQPEKFKNEIFSLKSVLRPHYPGEISNRNNHCSIWKTRTGNDMIIETSRFQKNSEAIFEIFSVYTKTQS